MLNLASTFTMYCQPLQSKFSSYNRTKFERQFKYNATEHTIYRRNVPIAIKFMINFHFRIDTKINIIDLNKSIYF